MTELVHLPAKTTEQEICDVLDRDAAVVIDRILDGEQLAMIQHELDPHFLSTDVGVNDFAGYETRRIGALMARSPACRRLALDTTINQTAASYLGRHADGYQLHFTQAVRIGPGETVQNLHRDRGVWGGYVPRRIETQLSTIWAIDDFTTANGATQLVPGSHTWDKNRVPQSFEIVSAEMKAGSVLIYSGTVLHGGGANESDSSRLGVLLHYTLNWLRQEENQYLSCPPEIAKELSPELRALMGYTRGGTVLGFYSSPVGPDEAGFELADPECLFDEPSPSQRPAE